MIFTNIAIDIVWIIMAGIDAVIAINVDTLIKTILDKVKYNMVNKVCGMWFSH